MGFDVLVSLLNGVLVFLNHIVFLTTLIIGLQHWVPICTFSRELTTAIRLPFEALHYFLQQVVDPFCAKVILALSARFEWFVQRLILLSKQRKDFGQDVLFFVRRKI